MLRGFTDSSGMEWRVWEVQPSQALSPDSAMDALSRSSLKNTPFADGWLCFESPREKRRLAPIPNGWQFRETPVLEELCAQATPVVVRKRDLTAS